MGDVDREEESEAKKGCLQLEVGKGGVFHGAGARSGWEGACGERGGGSKCFFLSGQNSLQVDMLRKFLHFRFIARSFEKLGRRTLQVLLFSAFPPPERSVRETISPESTCHKSS